MEKDLENHLQKFGLDVTIWPPILKGLGINTLDDLRAQCYGTEILENLKGVVLDDEIRKFSRLLKQVLSECQNTTPAEQPLTSVDNEINKQEKTVLVSSKCQNATPAEQPLTSVDDEKTEQEKTILVSSKCQNTTPAEQPLTSVDDEKTEQEKTLLVSSKGQNTTPTEQPLTSVDDEKSEQEKTVLVSSKCQNTTPSEQPLTSVDDEKTKQEETVLVSSECQNTTSAEQPLTSVDDEKNKQEETVLVSSKCQNTTPAEQPLTSVDDEENKQEKTVLGARYPAEVKHSLKLEDAEEDILFKLDLLQYYPEKITMQTVRKRTSDKLDTLNDVPWYVMNKILMLDYRGRDDMLPESILKDEQHDAINESKESLLKDDFDDMLSDCSNDSFESPCVSAPHPMDVIVAIFRCSSDMFRQILSEKMFMCKLSIPLVLPQLFNMSPTLLLWSLRDIILCGELDEVSVVNSPTAIVSFLKLGKVSRSKSKFVNEILNGQSHSTFFHRDCKNSTINSILSRGLVEMAWYLVSNEREKDQLNESAAFINLRGDAKVHENSCELVTKMSNVVVVMVDVHELEDADVRSSLRSITSGDAELVLMLSKEMKKKLDPACKRDIKNYVKELKCEHNIIYDFARCGEKNIKAVKAEVITKINSCLDRNQARKTLESFKNLAQSLNIQVDEDKPEMIKGQVLASLLKQDIEKGDIADSKVEKLPLQGKPWLELGKLEKEERRLLRKGSASVDHYVAKLHEEKKQLRRDQLSYLEKPSFLFETFLHNLLETKGTERIVFLKWLKYFLDDTSRETLPALKKEYSSLWREMHDDHELSNHLNETLDRLEEKIVKASFGLEHFMREVCQFYEAITSMKNEVKPDLKKRTCDLPQVMAELMLAGYPLELMDGDASHVPLVWVQAVLGKLKDLVGDKEIFVLSVLGIQSSGKSTLLNTMFGLQFAVGAGRCTRGVYAQLFPLSKSDPNMKYDYILVVDTEGLRAPELGQYKLQHDNEIATLVIGLGDLTLVNIKGENNAEMQDIFQIVIHALLKMKLVNKSMKLQPSCIFIHQNVGAPDAVKKMESGQQKFLNLLDSVTKAAGQQEDSPHLCKFKDIIEFDMENIWYFSDLWKGDPPMAPTNHGYSEKVNAVKKELLTNFMVNRASCLTISDVCSKIKDLWTGILTENFVFSFKNSLELNAYNSLDIKYSDLSSSLKTYALNWFSDARRDIMNCDEGIEGLESKLEEVCNAKLTSEFSKTHYLLVEFFDGHKAKEILEQWRARTLMSLKVSFDDILERTKTDVKNEIQIRKIQLDQRNDIEKHKKEIRDQAKEVASQLSNVENVSEEEVALNFNTMWSTWMKNMTTSYKVSPIDVTGVVKGVLYEKFRSDIPLLKTRLEKFASLENLRDNFPDIKEKQHLKLIGVAAHAKSFIGFSNYTHSAEEKVDDLFSKVERYIIELEGKNFRKEYAEALIDMVLELANDIKAKQLGYELKKGFTVYLAVHVCKFAIPKFTAMCEGFMRKIDPKTVFEESYKEVYFTEFKNVCEKSTQEKTAADNISTFLRNAIKDHVEEEIPMVLHEYSTKVTVDERNEADCNIPELRTKTKLLNSVLNNLLNLDSFDEYCKYINRFESCLMEWIQLYVRRYFASKENNVLLDIASSMIDNLVDNIICQITDAEKRALEDKNITNLFQVWAKLFYGGINSMLVISQYDLLTASQSNLEDLSFFTKILKDNLKATQKSLKMNFEADQETYLSSTGKDSVCRLLFEKCIGCPERCPYCKAPCAYTSPNHAGDHSALEHFPQGVWGVYDTGTEKIAIESCSVCIAENVKTSVHSPDGEYYPHRDYKKYFPDWTIESDPSMSGPLYWKRFMAKFGSELAKKYRMNPPDIPPEWELITIDDVRESLQNTV